MSFLCSLGDTGNPAPPISPRAFKSWKPERKSNFARGRRARTLRVDRRRDDEGERVSPFREIQIRGTIQFELDRGPESVAFQISIQQRCMHNRTFFLFLVQFLRLSNRIFLISLILPLSGNTRYMQLYDIICSLEAIWNGGNIFMKIDDQRGL